MLRKLKLTLSSVLLLSWPWFFMGLGDGANASGAWLSLGGLTLMLGFVPLFVLGERDPETRKPRVRYYWLWVALTFFCWTVATTWWIAIATPVAFLIPVGSLFFTLTPFLIFYGLRYRVPKAVGWTIFITAWIAFEALFAWNEISFPWLTLGYGPAGAPALVQWYELTGAHGGSLWFLVGNILFYEAWCQWRTAKSACPAHAAKRHPRPAQRSAFWRIAAPPLLWVVLPITASLVRYWTYTERPDPVRVAVVQPNIDPYEKYESLSYEEQRTILLSLASRVPAATELIVTPETSLEGGFWLDPSGHWVQPEPAVDQIRAFLCERVPAAVMIAGATTLRRYLPGEVPPPFTRHNDRWGYFDIYNSALRIDSSSYTAACHKSKLVPGAETIPYPRALGFIMKYVAVDLGGISGNLGRQLHHTTFPFADSTQHAGVGICYESIYSEYFTDYIRAGATLMCVITNDGWWHRTPGYRQHFSQSRLRAVETRRSIVRSANTGISALIDQRGDVLASAGWDQRTLLSGEVNASQHITPFVRYDCWLIRLALLVLGLSLLYSVAWHFRKKADEAGS